VAEVVRHGGTPRFALEKGLPDAQKGFTKPTTKDETARDASKNYIPRSGMQRSKLSTGFSAHQGTPAVTECGGGAASTAIAGVRKADYRTASGGCGRSMGGFAFSRSESKGAEVGGPGSSAEWGRRRPKASSERTVMPRPGEDSRVVSIVARRGRSRPTTKISGCQLWGTRVDEVPGTRVDSVSFNCGAVQKT